MAKFVDFASSQIALVGVDYPPANAEAVARRVLEVYRKNGQLSELRALMGDEVANAGEPAPNSRGEPESEDEAQAREEQERLEASTFTTTSSGSLPGGKESQLAADGPREATGVDKRESEAGTPGAVGQSPGSDGKPKADMLSAEDLGLAKKKR